MDIDRIIILAFLWKFKWQILLILLFVKVVSILKGAGINETLLWFGIPLVFLIAYLLDKYWWRNTETYRKLMDKSLKNSKKYK